MFVKICGITSETDALMSVAMGADALGFLFAPSPRRISPSKAADIIKRLPSNVLSVGVFRDESLQGITEVLAKTRLRAVQLHGHESREVTRAVSAEVPIVIKAFPAASPELEEAKSYGANVILIDAERPGKGQVFDWALAERSAGGKRVILAGGLTPENVSTAIAQTRPWGVDVSTGVESKPGRKDSRLVRRFVRAAKDAFVEETSGLHYEEAIYDWRAAGEQV